VAEATVRKRLERLVNEGYIHICALPEPVPLGLAIRAVLQLEVELPHVQAVTDGLRGLEEVQSLYRVTGGYDLLVDGLFSSNEHLLRFISQTLGSMPGIRRASTAHVLAVPKPLADWRLPRRRARVLVVDDDPDYVEITQSALEHEGFEVVTAANGREALERVRESTVDLAIMDVMMNGTLDGLATSRDLRGDRRFKDLPVIMVTSITQSEYASTFPTDEALPVDAFFTKPVNTQKLIAEVKRLLGRG
jgi:CheY-like chemotaxis protein/DNA-binding Lrp family transcriptional regulator